MWKAVLPNTFFGEYNPYQETVSGDWMISPAVYRHTGDVYLNGISFYEANSIEEVKNPQKRECVAVVPWTRKFEKILRAEQTILRFQGDKLAPGRKETARACHSQKSGANTAGHSSMKYIHRSTPFERLLVRSLFQSRRILRQI